MKCSDCLETVAEPREACILEAVARVLINRGCDPEALMKVVEEMSSDEFWNMWGGPMADWLEDRLEPEDRSNEEDDDDDA